ncbi:YopX family protein [Lactiplantibacillus plantarum]|uniref:Prophage Lp2 protein 26 n=4 Tax=Lactiplantibacillus plantarum TaxID=1590 RepID=A0AAW3RJT6_LACPN|nr:YopX family protein [Lactiplantibacillus plantarum]KPN44392.1 prophage Lp2 protein 26 [Lactiplantibacillus plantarum WJL]KZV05521.1 prophage Lp2 protein 26 [Lactiplantibacillus plantarum]KZV05647.1 prophage Lp2 protein 26 [Lactiplantibacillus plantarum]MDO8174390.1 YopX family protein [Lactiplantibacillus plantarum]WGJ12240.1 YopX family protein [Lactiplantibacillus plantarum]
MIKFRAWDNLLNKMLVVYRISFDGPVDGVQVHCYLDDRGAEGSTEYAYDGDGLILEQFTGLKDVNGKDIYVGDVVEVWSDASELTMVPAVNEVVSEDLFGRPGMFLKPIGQHLIEPCLHDSFIDQFKVIGNAHENPELLKG